jgi:hypothetical protein
MSENKDSSFALAMELCKKAKNPFFLCWVFDSIGVAKNSLCHCGDFECLRIEAFGSLHPEIS